MTPLERELFDALKAIVTDEAITTKRKTITIAMGRWLRASARTCSWSTSLVSASTP